jgi:hypothetical protein
MLSRESTLQFLIESLSLQHLQVYPYPTPSNATSPNEPTCFIEAEEHGTSGGEDGWRTTIVWVSEWECCSGPPGQWCSAYLSAEILALSM